MGTIEIKNRLHYLIDTIDDSERLKAIFTLLNVNDESTDWWDSLSTSDKESIDKGLKDIEEGKVHSHEDVMNRMKKKYPQLS